MLLRSILISFCLQQACLQLAWGQTQIDLQAQGKNVDFSGGAHHPAVEVGCGAAVNLLSGGHVLPDERNGRRKSLWLHRHECLDA
jgi:hypothetical protein